MNSAYKTALVTGASRGIGAAICRALVADGLTVHAMARDLAALETLSVELGPNLRPLACDVLDGAALASAIRDLEVDVLVNNAGGVNSVRPLWEQTPDETARTIALNLTVPLQIIQSILPGMIARGRGHVFNLCSTAGQGALAGTTVYGASKAALSHAGGALRFDLAGRNIRITEISPGRVDTEFYLAAFGGDASSLKSAMHSTHRSLAAKDIADALLMALHLPERANVTALTISPTDQALGGHTFPTRAPEQR